LSLLAFLLLIMRFCLISPLFPYTTLFRSYFRHPDTSTLSRQPRSHTMRITPTLKWLLASSCLAAASFTLPAQADQLADVRKAGELVIGTEMQFAPFDFLKDGKQEGFNKEFFAEVGKSLGVKIRFIDLPW